MIILRHSLFSLAGQDVMVLGFAAVSSVTVAVLAAVVGVVLALMLMGVAQVGCCGRSCGCCGLAALLVVRCSVIPQRSIGAM